MMMSEIQSQQQWRRSNHRGNGGDSVMLMRDIQSQQGWRRSNHVDDRGDPLMTFLEPIIFSLRKKDIMFRPCNFDPHKIFDISQLFHVKL